MLPFIKPKGIVSVIVAKRKPDGSTEPMHEEGQPDPRMVIAAEDLISAIHAKDANAVAGALEYAMSLGEESAPEESV